MKKFKTKSIQPGIGSTLKKISPDDSQEKVEQINDFYNQPSSDNFKKPLRNSRVVVLAMLTACLFGIISGFVGLFLFLSGALSTCPVLKDLSLESLMPTNSIIVEHREQVVVNEEEQVNQIIEDMSKVVVGIFKTKPKGQTVLDDVYLENELVSSGFVLTEDGWIITASQNIDPNTSYTIITYDRQLHAVDQLVVGQTSGVAWLKISASGLPVSKLAQQDSLVLGQKLIALRSSVSNNMVNSKIVRLEKASWKNISNQDQLVRQSETYDRLIKIQEDLGVKFIGAPLINLAGELVGISLTTNYFTNTAIPVDYFQPVISQVLKSGLVVRPHLGLEYLDLSQAVGARIELVVTENNRRSIVKGALVTSLAKYGPAEKAGVKVNDIIIQVDEGELNQEYGLTESVLNHKVGDEITLTIWRTETQEPLELKVVLE